jgi:hypothetical protein
MGARRCKCPRYCSTGNYSHAGFAGYIQWVYRVYNQGGTLFTIGPVPIQKLQISNTFFRRVWGLPEIMHHILRLGTLQSILWSE